MGVSAGNQEAIIVHIVQEGRARNSKESHNGVRTKPEALRLIENVSTEASERVK